jgi:DNA-binding NarL/FixJ family response regulator
MGGCLHRSPTAPMTRVLIADVCEVVLSGVRRILEAQPGLQIVGEATHGEEAISKALALHPDVAIVEICLPGKTGIYVTSSMRKYLPQTEVLIFTLHEEELWFSEGLRAGARGYVFKSDPGHCLLDATRSLAIHVPYFTARVGRLLLQSYRAAPRTRARFPSVPSKSLSSG